MSGGAVRIRHRISERGDDLYETPPEAVLALLAAGILPPAPSLIWEPACGPGSIARTLRTAGYAVLATDLVDYGSGDQDEARRDFLFERTAPDGLAAIVTNPPYKTATAFVERAIELAPLVVMLLRLQFLEGVGRSALIDGGQLARVLVFRNRLPMMHRAGWDGPTATSSTAFAWFVWRRDHSGPAIVDRLSWRAPG